MAPHRGTDLGTNPLKHLKTNHLQQKYPLFTKNPTKDKELCYVSQI
jgi:hypothetical protein